MKPFLQAQADAVNTWAQMQKDVEIIAKVGINNSVTTGILGKSEAIVNPIHIGIISSLFFYQVKFTSYSMKISSLSEDK